MYRVPVIATVELQGMFALLECVVDDGTSMRRDRQVPQRVP